MLRSKKHAIIDTISHPLLQENPELWASVVPMLHTKSYGGDARIVSHGDAASSLWLVVSGWVKLTRQTPDGKESITGLCTQGDVFGEAALFANANYPYSAEVVGEAAELVAVPAATIRALVAKEPTLSARVMALLNERTAQAQLKLEHMTTMSAAQRLGCFLLRLCHTQMGGSKTIQIPVEKHILAAYLGMKPETLSRSQQQLKPVGVAVSGQSLTVGDIGKLRQFVCNSCSESGSCDVEDTSN
jgi:CRP-like cAMP-binding protein